jgi:outer membrane receptor for monomeric catechols
VPQSVTVITDGVIADQGMRGMADVVRYVPGVTMAQGEGNRDQATIRGNNTTAGFFVDGMRDDVQYFRDLYRGSGSARERSSGGRRDRGRRSRDQRKEPGRRRRAAT